MGKKQTGRKEKVRKPPLGRRLGNRIRTAGLVSADAVRNPRGIPRTAHGAFRRWLRRIWNTRGGGLYTLGYALTFAALEVKTFIEELAGLTSPGDYFAERLIEFLMRFGADSITNLVLSLLWPVFIVTWYPPVGVGLFVVALLAFPRFVKPHIERWLFREGGDRPLDAPAAPEDEEHRPEQAQRRP